jgi:hypothetical protein
MNHDHESLAAPAGDVPGIAPVGRVLASVANSDLSAAEALLGRVCLPAAEELGLLLRDKAGAWRQKNIATTLSRSKDKLEQAAVEGRRAPPRLIMESLNHASWTEDGQVQEMWAGLLVSSCTDGGTDDSNWIFISLLRELTPMQARILRYACETAQKVVFPDGLIGAEPLRCDSAIVCKLANCDDVHRIDRELDHLRTLGLLQSGFDSFSPVTTAGGGLEADLQPTGLALHMYVRTQGSRRTPNEFFAVPQPLGEAQVEPPLQ